MPIIQAILRSWKTSIYDLAENNKNLIIQYEYLIKSQQIYCVNRLNSKEIYDNLIAENVTIRSSQQQYNNLFRDADLEWKISYILPRILSLETKVRVFQCKLLNNNLYLNKMLLTFRKVRSSLCSFCKQQTELQYIYFETVI